jgi:cell division protein FtsX
MATAHKSHDSAHDLSTEDRKEMKASTYAFPAQRKEPLNDASHVRNAIARFDQVKDVTDSEREEAFRHIQAAAEKFGVEMTETHWKQLGRKPHTANSAQK